MITILGCENKIQFDVPLCVCVWEKYFSGSSTSADNCPQKFLANFAPTNWANWTSCTEARSIFPQGKAKCCCKLKFYEAAYNTLETWSWGFLCSCLLCCFCCCCVCFCCCCRSCCRCCCCCFGRDWIKCQWIKSNYLGISWRKYFGIRRKHTHTRTEWQRERERVRWER